MPTGSSRSAFLESTATAVCIFSAFPFFFCLRFASCGHQTSTTNINVFPPVPKWRPSRSRWLPEFDWLLVFQQKPASLEPIFTSAAGAKERSGNYLASFVFQERERGASSESGRVPVACLSTRAPSDESGPLWNDPVSVRVRLVPTVRFFHRLVIWPPFFLLRWSFIWGLVSPNFLSASILKTKLFFLGNCTKLTPQRGKGTMSRDFLSVFFCSRDSNIGPIWTLNRQHRFRELFWVC